MFSDGYDYVSIAYAAPSAGQRRGIAKATLGPVFSSGVVGILIGGVSWRPGRLRRATRCSRSLHVLSRFVTLGTVSASSVRAMIVALPDWLGVGGIAPLCLVVANEYAPQACAQ